MVAASDNSSSSDDNHDGAYLQTRSLAHRKRVGYAKPEMLQHYAQDRAYRNAATVQDRERCNAWGQRHKENLDRFNNVDFNIVNNSRVYQQK